MKQLFTDTAKEPLKNGSDVNFRLKCRMNDGTKLLKGKSEVDVLLHHEHLNINKIGGVFITI